MFAIGDLLEAVFGPARPSKRQVAGALFKFWYSAVDAARQTAIEERQYLERKMNCTCPYNCEC